MEMAKYTSRRQVRENVAWFAYRMALWNTFGDYLENSGRTTALVQAEVATSGTANSFLKASHLTRTRHAHQFTLLALCMLQEEAFKLINGSTDCDNDLKET